MKISNLSTCPPGLKLRMEAAHIRLERMQKNAGQNYLYFWLNSMSKIAKIAKLPPKILWMIQKIFEKIFLPQEFFNGPIRKVITSKVKFDDRQNFSYVARSKT